MTSDSIYSANLSPGGIKHEGPCVYIVTASGGAEKKFYIGRTLTSNNTGTSSPFKRLGTHLAKRGNTQSMLWKDSKTLREAWLAEAEIGFFALPVSPDEVSLAEKWLMKQFQQQNLLNSSKTLPKTAPEISKQQAVRLTKLVEMAKG